MSEPSESSSRSSSSSRIPPAMPPRAVQPVRRDGGEVGVYYHDTDYAGVFRRLLIDLLDVIVAGIVSLVYVAAVYTFLRPRYEGDERPVFLAFFGSAGLWFVYFVLLKRSPLRTLGYRVGGVRIVNLRGNRPGIIALTVRLLFAFVGPFNFLIDLIWIGNDPNRQALRDKFARTYVVRARAQPAGTGAVKYEYYGILGTNFIFAEVGRASAPPPPAAAATPPPATVPA